MATIITKFSSTASAVPLATDLVQGELAVNTADKRLFTEDSGATIIEIGTNPSSITTGAITATGTVTANSSLLSSNATFTGGTVNGVVIGGSTPQAITGTLITANTNFSGALTGNVTGNLTGNVTGNVTGDLTGNVTASTGTTTLNNLAINGTVDFNTAVLTDLGTPVADTDAATKGYVDTEIAGLVDSAPGTLDTLNELAAALGDDPDFATTITNQIATKLALAGGTMTGAIAMGTNKITGLGTPTVGTDAANKTYADTKLSLSGGTMTGNITLGSNSATSTATPTTDDELTRKGYVDGILGSATSAATSAAAAATSASNAATSESNASTSASNAATSATAAAASYDSFDDRYLGAKASDPTLDNDGDALIAGATYFNTTSNAMKVYSGSAWSDVAPVATSITASQISDVTATAAELNILDGVTATTAELNYVDGVTSNIQTQLDNISVTSGTLTKTFAQDEVATITLSSSVTTPVVSVTKEVNQTGVTNNTWDVNSTSENYTRLDSAPATTLDFGFGDPSYSGDSFDTSNEDGTPWDVKFNTSGTKMFLMGRANDTIYQYSLSTAFDITTATYDSVSLSVASQATVPSGFDFNDSGTRIYVTANSDTNIYQYNLTTAFDLSTASYSTALYVGGHTFVPLSISIRDSGTKVYILSQDKIYHWNLSTADDISTGTYSGDFLDVSNEDNDMRAMVMSSDGTKIYTVGDTNDKIFEYTLSTAFDVTSGSYANFSVATQGSNSTGLAFDESESALYTIDYGTPDKIYRYNRAVASLTLGSGSFASADVGKTIEANSGVFVLTSTAGAVSQTTAPTSYAQVASGSWEMYAVVYNTTDGDLELSNKTDNYSIQAASYDSVSFSFAANGTDVTGIAFNNDGTKLFMVNRSNDRVNEYSLSTAYDPSTATFTQYFSVGSQEANPRGLLFSPDGTKMYVSGSSSQLVHKYNLTTGYDISTASYSNTTLNTSNQDSWPSGMAWNADGTVIFVVGQTNDRVNGYSCPSAYDAAGGSHISNYTISQDTSPTDVAFNADGTKMFVSGLANDKVYEYGLSTAYTVNSSTVSYVRDFSVATQENQPSGLIFNNDGSKMYVSGEQNNTIFQYSTVDVSAPTGYHAVHTTTSTDSTYWTDINSMTADEAAGDGNIYYCVSTDDRSTWKIAHNTDGIRSIVRNNSGTWQYNSNGTYGSETWTNATTNTELNALQEAMTGASAQSNAFDISTASYNSVSFSTASQETTPRGVTFNNDGTKMFVIGNASDSVHEYDLSTAFDISSASFSQSFSVSSQGANPYGMTFSSDGTKMYVVDGGTDDVNQYNLSTGFDISSASYSQTLATGANPSGVEFNNDGTKMFISRAGATDIVDEYTLSTGYDISTATFVDGFSVSGQDSMPQSVRFNTDGTKMYILGGATDAVYEYNLSVGFDVSSASYSQSFSVTTQDNQPFALAFNSDGSKMYIGGHQNDAIFEYTVGSTSYTNQMNKTQLDAVSDANHFTLANDLDLGIIFNLSSGTTVPSSDGVSINYDANVLNKGAILGTDYDFDAPAATKVRITALAANNLKVRVV